MELKKQAALGAERRGQIKTGDRSEKSAPTTSRKPSLPRIGLTLHQLTDVMEETRPLVDGLPAYEAER
jgi:protein subunit release factor A